MSKGDRIKHALEFSFIIVILAMGTLGIIFSVRAYPKTFETKILFEKENQEVNPEDSLAMSFSEQMITESVVNGIKIIPKAEISFQWHDSNKKLVITPGQNWKPETKYQLKAAGLKNIMFINSDAEFSFYTAPYPRVKSFFPEQRQKDAIIGIEDPIKFAFDKSLDSYQIKFSIQPSEILTYQLGSEKDAVELLPKSVFEEGKEYAIDVYIRHKNEPGSEYQKIHSSSFVTKVFPTDPKKMNLADRLAIVKRKTEPKIKEGKYIDINVKEQVMAIFEGGKLVEAFLISSGKKGMDTPQGTFKIYNKHPRPWSKKYSLYMPYWMAIAGSGLYGIHELPEWPSGYKEGQNHLGIPVSHGCVRLGVGAAAQVYNWADIGTPVIIHS